MGGSTIGVENQTTEIGHPRRLPAPNSDCATTAARVVLAQMALAIRNYDLTQPQIISREYPDSEKWR
jgi:hypothetical protein